MPQYGLLWFGVSLVWITAVVPSNEIDTPVPENCENIDCVDVDDVVGVVGVVGAGVGVFATGVVVVVVVVVVVAAVGAVGLLVDALELLHAMTAAVLVARMIAANGWYLMSSPCLHETTRLLRHLVEREPGL